MGLDQKDALIVAQNASTGAASIVASLGMTTVDDALEAFDTIRTAIFEGTFALVDADLESVITTAPSGGRGGRGGYSGGGSSRGRSPQRGRASSGGGNTDPGTVDFRSGKFAGKTIADVYDEDPSYLEWCVNNLKNDFMVGRIEEYLAQVA